MLAPSTLGDFQKEEKHRILVFLGWIQAVAHGLKRKLWISDLTDLKICLKKCKYRISPIFRRWSKNSFIPFYTLPQNRNVQILDNFET